jgi:hypothetical protein
MKQIQQFKEQEQETVSLDRSIGNLFQEFLEVNGKTAQGDFDHFASQVNVSLNGEFLRLTPKGFPALVKDILKVVVKAKDIVGLKFHPAVAGG